MRKDMAKMKMTRPDWVTEDVINELIRLKDASENNFLDWTPTTTYVFDISYNELNECWVNGKKRLNQAWIMLEGLRALELYGSDSNAASKKPTAPEKVNSGPCDYCDMGSGPTGVGMLGFTTCPRCNGSKMC